MQVSARLDYATRALVELAAAAPERRTRDQLAEAQDIPAKYLEAILTSLRQAGLVRSHRGPDGGFELAGPTESITVADVARAVDGPLTLVQGQRPEDVSYDDTGLDALVTVWVAVRSSLRSVLEAVTIADLRDGSLPDHVVELVAAEDAWLPR